MCSSNSFDKQRPSCMISTSTKNITVLVTVKDSLLSQSTRHQPGQKESLFRYRLPYSTFILEMYVSETEQASLLLPSLPRFSQHLLIFQSFPLMLCHLNVAQLASMYPVRKYLCRWRLGPFPSFGEKKIIKPHIPVSLWQ